MAVHLQGEQARIDTLLSFPDNPRISDLGAIKESIRTLGQYQPIVVHRSTRRIVAGNHVWEAMRDLGYTHINVTWIDGSEDDCRRKVLADNRIADIADYNLDDLITLQESLDDLIGTGYEAVTKIADLPLTAVAPRPEKTTPRRQIVAGPFKAKISHEEWEAFDERMKQQAGGKRRLIPYLIADLLGIVCRVKSRSIPEDVPVTLTGIEMVELPIDSVHPFHNNPRVGDVGALCESLRINGQYRPIVVNRRTREILVGNHRWMAAKALGWNTIGVAWVDVDDQTAIKINLADNRTSDLGSYDNKTLRRFMLSVSSLEGTGWDGDDLDDLIAGLEHRAKASKRFKVQIGDYRIPAIPSDLAEWIDTLPDGQELEYISDLLDIDIDA